jgi:hypothetical protein
MEIGDALQSLLYGQLTVDIRNPTYIEQLEIVRVIVANPGATRRLKIVGDVHPWVSMLLKSVDEREKIRGEKTDQKAKLESGSESGSEPGKVQVQVQVQASLPAQEKVSTQ